MNFLLHTVSAL